MAITLLWHRTDLRLQDNAGLQQAITGATQLLPIYVWDERFMADGPLNLPRCGSHRTQFISHSLLQLRQAYQNLGSDLLLLQGQPEQLLPQLAQALGAQRLHYCLEATPEEQQVEAKLLSRLKELGISAQPYWGHTLYHPDDLPFTPSHLPDQFADFRRRVERQVPIRKPIAVPSALPPLPDTSLALQVLPASARLNLADKITFAQSALPAGENGAHTRLQHYLWQTDLLRSYKQTRNGLLGTEYSSGMSAYLAQGCISARQLYTEVQAYEQARVRNESTYWLIFELLWRDYFRLLALKQGRHLFRLGGIKNLALPWRSDPVQFKAWAEGYTGYPILDAAQRELISTGYVGNRARQLLASFLTKNLGLDWRMGAAWFEHWLVDYDPCSNYGNWNYAAGVGTDPRGFRFFHITQQAYTHDPEGAYVKHWLPQLQALPPSRAHQPWLLSPQDQVRFNLPLPQAYSLPIVPLEASAKANERLYNQAVANPLHRKGNYKLRHIVRGIT